MPRKRRSKPLSSDQGALGQAIELFIAEDEHMTQEKVAEDSGLNIKQINEFVRGKGNPTYMTLLKLSRGLHVRPGELMTRVDELREKRARR